MLQAFLVAATIAVVMLTGMLSPLERPVADMLMRLPHPGGDANGPIAAVVIDDRSLKLFGPAPWPRERIAALVHRIVDGQPAGIVMDTILSEPTDPAADLALRDALQGTEKALAAALSPGGGWLLPTDSFGGVATAAHAHAETDSDGVVRSVAATKQASGLALPALSIAAAQILDWQGSFQPGQLVRPDFRQGPGSVMTVSAADLLNPEGRATEAFLGRVVFVGYSASGVGDQYFVPVGERNRTHPGVLVHAAATSSILRGGLLTPLPVWLTLPLLLFVAFAIQILRSRSGRLDPRHFSLILLGILLAAVLVLWLAHVIVPTVAFLLAAVSSAVVRETAESRLALRETGTILQNLIHESGTEDHSSLPRGPHGRLKLVRTLQGQLAQDRNLRRTLLEGLNEGVILWGEEGEPLVTNSALVDLWGPPPLYQEVRDLLRLEEHKSNGLISSEIERFGRRLEILLHDLPPGHLGLIRDITERAELDRRRREMHRLVSHELKTPLAAISGFGEMLQTYDVSESELHRVAGLIAGEADRLGEMVRAFLDLERLDTAFQEADRTSIDIASLVRERSDVLASAASSRLQTISLSVSSSAQIIGAEQLLSQLIDNLVGNALKFSPDRSEVRVEVVPCDDTKVQVSVSDTGPGIPSKSIPHLFERFYRVPGSKPSGSGLGLALVRETADAHGATVHVESAEGAGTTFSVIFPMAGESE